MEPIQFYLYAKSFGERWKSFWLLYGFSLFFLLFALLLICNKFNEASTTWQKVIPVALFVLAVSLILIIWHTEKKRVIITSFRFDEDALHVIFNESAFNLSIRWEDIEQIRHYTGGTHESEDGSETEYPKQTLVTGTFRNRLNAASHQSITILDEDFWCEQEISLLDAFTKFNKDKDKLKVFYATLADFSDPEHPKFDND